MAVEVATTELEEDEAVEVTTAELDEALLETAAFDEEEELTLELAEEAAGVPQLMPPIMGIQTESLLSRPAPVRSMAAALAVAKRARTGRREYIVNEIGRVGRLT